MSEVYPKLDPKGLVPSRGFSLFGFRAAKSKGPQLGKKPGRRGGTIRGKREDRLRIRHCNLEGAL